MWAVAISEYLMNNSGTHKWHGTLDAMFVNKKSEHLFQKNKLIQSGIYSDKAVENGSILSSDDNREDALTAFKRDGDSEFTYSKHLQKIGLF